MRQALDRHAPTVEVTLPVGGQTVRLRRIRPEQVAGALGCSVPDLLRRAVAISHAGSLDRRALELVTTMARLSFVEPRLVEREEEAGDGALWVGAVDVRDLLAATRQIMN